jgi:hypothetical protein
LNVKSSWTGGRCSRGSLRSKPGSGQGWRCRQAAASRDLFHCQGRAQKCARAHMPACSPPRRLRPLPQSVQQRRGGPRLGLHPPGSRWGRPLPLRLAALSPPGRLLLQSCTAAARLPLVSTCPRPPLHGRTQRPCTWRVARWCQSPPALVHVTSHHRWLEARVQCREGAGSPPWSEPAPHRSLMSKGWCCPSALTFWCAGPVQRCVGGGRQEGMEGWGLVRLHHRHGRP